MLAGAKPSRIEKRNGNRARRLRTRTPKPTRFDQLTEHSPWSLGIARCEPGDRKKNAREDDMKISVITGPFLRSNDPIRYDVKIPRSCWKVIAFIHDDTKKLCATGYTISQDAFLPEEEFVFGQYTAADGETTQVALATIEERAGISFGKLSDHDPLAREEGFGEVPLGSDFSRIRFF